MHDGTDRSHSLNNRTELGTHRPEEGSVLGSPLLLRHVDGGEREVVSVVLFCFAGCELCTEQISPPDWSRLTGSCVSPLSFLSGNYKYSTITSSTLQSAGL